MGVVIGGKIPDFINTNHQKKLIEVYCKFYKSKDYEKKRRKVFRKFSYTVLFLSDKDLELDRVSRLEKNRIICTKKIKAFLKV